MGFTPIKSIIEHSLAQGNSRQIKFYWGARTRADLYLHDLAQQWNDDHEHITYIPVLSQPNGDNQWHGRTGFVHEAVLNDFDDLSSHEVYTCGPPPMVHSVRNTFVKHGVNEEFIYSDSFDFQKEKEK